MNDAITPDTIVRLRYDHRVIGLVREVDDLGGRAAVAGGGPPSMEVVYWIALSELELVPWEELGEVPFVLVA